MEFKTWQDGRIKLYHGDCLEFMENMQEQVNLVLTDPPYLYLDHKFFRQPFYLDRIMFLRQPLYLDRIMFLRQPLYLDRIMFLR